MITKHNGFNEVLKHVLEKVDVLKPLEEELQKPTFDENGENDWHVKIIGEKSHFNLSLATDSKETESGWIDEVKGIKFNITYPYPDETQGEKWVSMVFYFDGTVYYNFLKHDFDDNIVQLYLDDIKSVLENRYKNPKVYGETAKQGE